MQSTQLQGQVPANQGQPAVVQWDPEPAKAVTKQAYDLGVAALATAATPAVKAVYAKVYGDNAVNNNAIDLAVTKVKEVAKRGTDALANKAYATQDSIGSRIAKLYQQ